MTTREDLAKATELYLSLFALAVQGWWEEYHGAGSTQGDNSCKQR